MIELLRRHSPPVISQATRDTAAGLPGRTIVNGQWDKPYEIMLVLRCQWGDDAAFEELLRLHSPPLRRYVQHLLSERDCVDDVLQDVWVAAYRGLPKLRDAAAFPSWLHRIARARAAREFRCPQLAMGGNELVDIPDPSSDEPPVDCEEVRHELARLAPAHREVLVLRFLNNLTYDEIAAVTEQPAGTIRSRIHYARRALARALKSKPQ